LNVAGNLGAIDVPGSTGGKGGENTP
jgi:hypothetical protein